MPINSENKNEGPDIIDSSNIFDDFMEDIKLDDTWDDKIGNKEKRDTYYYLNIAGNIFQSLFLLLLVISALLFGYIYLQEDEKYTESSSLEPICYLLIGWLDNPNSGCATIAGLNKVYDQTIEETKSAYVEKIVNNIEEIHKYESVENSKDMMFLMHKWSTRLQVTEMLNKFDKLKTAYNPLNKDKIQCSQFEITEDGVLYTECTAFASWYERWIIWYDGWDKDKVYGTSVSLANSFLNYLELTPSDFSLIDRQREFTIETVDGIDTWFKIKTTFGLKMKYNTSTLSF